jgi:hypothetical protein
MSNRATTAAKGRPKKSYARGKSRKEDPEAMILWMPDETFCEEMSEWVDSPEGQLWLDISDTLEVPLTWASMSDNANSSGLMPSG